LAEDEPEVDTANVSYKPLALESNLRDSNVLMGAFNNADRSSLIETREPQVLQDANITFPDGKRSQNQIALVQTSVANYNKDIGRYNIQFPAEVIDPLDPDFTTSTSSMRTLFDKGRENTDL
jgi:hypothetical protein